MHRIVYGGRDEKRIRTIDEPGTPYVVQALSYPVEFPPCFNLNQLLYQKKIYFSLCLSTAMYHLDSLLGYEQGVVSTPSKLLVLIPVGFD